VFNIVHGGRESVDALLTHPKVRAVSFVGSTPIAKYIYETGIKHGKRVQANGGAKNYIVVMPDADVGKTVENLATAAFGCAGERCMAGSTAIAVGAAADRMLPELVKAANAIKVGPTDRAAQPDMGPVITAAHRDKIAGYIGAGADAGATVVVDGRDLAVDGRPDGFFIGPTLLDDVTTDMSVYTDEIFGPVLTVVRAPSYEAAVGLVNDNAYGNGVALFTRDGGAARRFQFEVEAGMVGINVPIPVPMAYYSFGGWNQSLFGDTHMHGTEGVHFYTRGKVVTSRWPSPATAPAARPDLGFPTNG
jgi:malonate-semialdehyde dehydrogenase (acetylating)/methylmalonate-semialdehyde dehydrogenase